MPLEDYLVVTLRMDADLSRLSGDLVADLTENQTDPEALLSAAIALELEINEMASEGVEELSTLTPPVVAQIYHDSLLSLMEDLEAFTGRLADALEANDPREVAQVLIELSSSLGLLAELSQKQHHLIKLALQADGESQLDSYLIAAMEARSGIARAASEYFSEAQYGLQSGDPTAVVPLIEELVAALEEYEREFSQLSPPVEAEDTHQRQADLIALQISGEQEFLRSLRDEDPSALVSALLRLQDIGAEGSYASAEWDELMIEALQR